MATMLGAGRKNDDNTFSGVLIGDVKEGTNNEKADPLTGVYGFNKGVIKYALREDGTALFDSNGGRIELNDNGIIINANILQISDKNVLESIDESLKISEKYTDGQISAANGYTDGQINGVNESIASINGLLTQEEILRILSGGS